MNRMVYAVIALLLIGACLPSNLIPIATAQPTLDGSGVTQAVAQANPTQTATVQPTTAVVSVTGTSAPPTASPIPVATETATTSPVPDLTTTPATATEFISTATLAVPGVGTITSTPGVLTYGTLPPAVPFSQIRITNRAKAQAYISLQVTTLQGGPTIIEYPVKGSVEFKAPTGFYLYVAWVGGNKMVGNFRLQQNDDISIVLYKDRVEIK